MYDVLISGGGPVGLGLAIELGRRGRSVAVVERHDTPPRIPKGQNLTQRTMEHMRAWGVEDAIRAAKTIPKGVGLGGLTAYGSLLSGYHFDWFKRASVAPFYAAANERLPQYATEAVLRHRVCDLPGVEMLTGWTTSEVSQTAEHAALTARHGNEIRVLQGRYLVGCDGSRSTVRAAAGISETRNDHDRLMVLIVFTSPEFHDLTSRYQDKQFFKVLHPDLDGYWMFFGMVEWGNSFFFHAPVPPDANRDNFDFKALIRRAVGASFDLSLDYVGFWDLRIAQADRYRAGRIFIAGDAAHSHPPYGGYGINTGFEDARNLGWKLDAVLSGWGGAALLDSYHAERHPVFASTARDFIERFIEEDQAFVRTHDPETDPAAFSRAWARFSHGGAAQGIASFAPHYGGSPIVVGSAEPAPSAAGVHEFAARPGHHLAPLQGDEPVEIGLDAFTLISADAGTADDFRNAAAKLGIPLEVAPTPDEGARKALDAQAVLVRPDGFVAWAGQDGAGAGDILRTAAGH